MKIIVFLTVFIIQISLSFAVNFNYSVIHRQAESICIGWGTPPIYDFSSTNGTYVPYSGAGKDVDLNTKHLTLGDNLTMQHSSVTTTSYPNCTGGTKGYYNHPSAGDYIIADRENIGEGLTVMMWTDADNSDIGGLGMAQFGGIGDGFNTMLYTGQLYIEIYLGYGGTYYSIAEPDPCGDGNWHQRAWVLNQTADTIKYYCDGAYINTDAFTQDIINNGQIHIGGYLYGGTDYGTNVSYDEVYYISKILSQTEINTTYQFGRNASAYMGTGILGYWNMDNNTADWSGNGNNGTIQGSGNLVVESSTPYSCTPYNITTGSVTNKSITYDGNFKMNTNLNITGCIIYNGNTTLGTCI